MRLPQHLLCRAAIGSRRDLTMAVGLRQQKEAPQTITDIAHAAQESEHEVLNLDAAGALLFDLRDRVERLAAAAGSALPPEAQIKCTR